MWKTAIRLFLVAILVVFVRGAYLWFFSNSVNEYSVYCPDWILRPSECTQQPRDKYYVNKKNGRVALYGGARAHEYEDCDVYNKRNWTCVEDRYLKQYDIGFQNGRFFNTTSFYGLYSVSWAKWLAHGFYDRVGL